jgi:tetratricopeptide (TPR) repeat protein/predicted Ser/Thr protein kinase
MVTSARVGLADTLIDAAVDDTLPPRPGDDDPVEARGVLDAVAARMFGATPQPLKVGRFVLLDRIGRGGMGVVYAAYDPQLDRKIAIKLLAPPGDGSATNPEAEARLLREARAAARLDHPNVVTIHEVGTWQGRVFVAMEFVEGLTLKGWLAAASRTPAEILGVFLQAGRGLAAAHAAGIVHRDFKPENALVAKDGTVHVVDFGLARASMANVDAIATGENEVSDAELTRTGAVMGTPAYMAPEQHRGEPAGVAADQFAFCVALWEAWYGARPFKADTMGALALAVLEGDIAAPPADSRVPARHRRILEQGLATEPGARHASMNALLDALAHDPGRRPRQIAIGSAIAIGLVGAGLALGHTAATPDDPCDGGTARHAEVWNDARRSEIRSAFTATGKPYAAVALAQIEQRLDDRAIAWAASHRDACTATRVRAEQSDEMLDLRMGCLDRRLGEVSSLVELFAQADDQAVTRAVRSLDGLTPIDACDDTAALREIVPLPEEPEARAEIVAIQTEIGRGRQLRDLGRFAEAVRIGTETTERVRALGHPPTLAEALVLLASSQAHAGELDVAQATFETAVWAAIAGRNATAQTEATIALVTITGYSLENVDDGKRWGEHARAVLRAQGDPPSQLATLEGNLGNVQMTRGDRKAALEHFYESIRLYEQSLGPEHMHVGRMMGNLAVALRQEGDLDGAEKAYERAIVLLERTLGPGHPDMGSVVSNYGALLGARGDIDGALAKYRTALEIGEASVEPGHPQLGHANNNIGGVLLDKGDHVGAERHARKAIEIWEAALGPKHSLLASAYGTLGHSLLAQRRVDEAIAALERAIALPRGGISAEELDEHRVALERARSQQ